MSNSREMSRRKFLKSVAAAAAAPYVITSFSLAGTGDKPAPSKRITMACIGLGWQGPGNMKSFLGNADCQVLAVCDVDKNHLAAGKKIVDDKYKNKDCKAYTDFREVMARTDIDTVSLALPDHWHSIPAILAAKSGKDIYGEKPFSHSLKEGRAMIAAIERYGRIWQTGSWQRSTDNFYRAVSLVRAGKIGKVKLAEVGLPNGTYKADDKDKKTQPVPPGLDYEMWQGPAPEHPYVPARVHKNWRWFMDYGGGQLMDWVGHHIDIGHWGLDMDSSGPAEILDPKCKWLTEGCWDCMTDYSFTAKYANGVEFKIASQGFQLGTKWYGEDGQWVYVNRGKIDANPKSLLKETIPDIQNKVYHSTNHYRNFLDCVKSRQPTITPPETAHRSASVGHLGTIALRVNRNLKWDPAKEEILGDEEASRYLMGTIRAPWSI